MKRILWACILTSIPAFATPAYAGLGSRAVRETAEFLIGKFGREAAGEGAERLAGRLASAAARHGDGVLTAVRKVGPGAIGVVEGAGAEAPGCSACSTATATTRSGC
ncbi:hypothetical protein [Singulisphaera sp. PoT]|uniref:hypothetical protein n=1 Tax=Singulisphaera sp. PoT TaxID=3411797 RepID=UPI003BF6024D